VKPRRSNQLSTRLSVQVVRRKGAPKKPSQAQLTRLLTLGLTKIQASRRAVFGKHELFVVDVLLVDDAVIAALNQAHLRHTGPTDVLSFPMGEFDPERGAFHLGEVVVSFETARREAAARRLPFAEELTRYIVHGFLHCLGYEDDTALKAKVMRALQERLIKSL